MYTTHGNGRNVSVIIKNLLTAVRLTYSPYFSRTDVSLLSADVALSSLLTHSDN